MTQSFFSTQEQTGRQGVYVSLEQNVQDVNAILDGKFDDVNEVKFMNIGSAATVRDSTSVPAGVVGALQAAQSGESPSAQQKPNIKPQPKEAQIGKSEQPPQDNASSGQKRQETVQQQILKKTKDPLKSPEDAKSSGPSDKKSGS